MQMIHHETYYKYYELLSERDIIGWRKNLTAIKTNILCF